MGTASLTLVYDGDDKMPLVAIDAGYDGYPEGMGADLIAFLQTRQIVEGIGGKIPEGRVASNGSGDLAAQLIAHLKEKAPVGGYYVTPYDRRLEEEYNYIYKIRVYPGKDYASIVMTGAKSWKSSW